MSRVHVVTDSSSCLSEELAAQHGITVLDLHTSGEGTERTTAGLGQLELAAAYARLLERGQDAGVVALHISKELSATWTNAVTAAGIFPDTVRVVDTNSAGMVLGYAAIAASQAAATGADVEQVAQAAQEAIGSASLWLYVSRLDSLRKGGRLSTSQTLLTTALATRPIFHLEDGKLALASKARTQSKALDRLVELVQDKILPGSVEKVRDAVAKAKELHNEDIKARNRAKTKAAMRDIVSVKKQSHAKADSGAQTWDADKALEDRVESMTVEALSEHIAAQADAVDDTQGPLRVNVAIHHTDAMDVAQDLEQRLRTMAGHLCRADSTITVAVESVHLTDAIMAHTGPDSVGVVVYSQRG